MAVETTMRAVTRDDLAAHRRTIEGVGLFPSEMLDEMAEPYLSGSSDEI